MPNHLCFYCCSKNFSGLLDLVPRCSWIVLAIIREHRLVVYGFLVLVELVHVSVGSVGGGICWNTNECYWHLGFF